MGTTSAQKKLFFNLKKIKNQIAPGQEGDLKDDQVNEISKRLDVDSNEVINMNRRMMGQEKSLNDPIKQGETDEWQDWLVDESLDQELAISQKQEFEDKKELLNLISLLNLEKLFNENNLQKKIIEENGKNLSQGQIQKISLLRSLMNKYEILIIDEGTSNIDKNDEKKIIDHLFNLYKNKKLNIIFISHSSAYDNMFNQKIILRNEKYD